MRTAQPPEIMETETSCAQQIGPEAQASIVRLSSSNFASICFACKGSRVHPRAAEFRGWMDRVNLLGPLLPSLKPVRWPAETASSSILLVSSLRIATPLACRIHSRCYGCIDHLHRTFSPASSTSRREEVPSPSGKTLGRHHQRCVFGKNLILYMLLICSTQVMGSRAR